MISALTVLYLVLPLLVAFVVHDAEEIVTQHKWMVNHADKLIHRFPKAKRVISHLRQLNTKAFALAAFEEFIILLLATACLFVGSPYALYIWSALFMAFSIHLLVHIAQAIIVKGYVPGLVSAVLLLPYAGFGVVCLYNFMTPLMLTLLSLAGLIFAYANLMFAHWMGKKIFKS